MSRPTCAVKGCRRWKDIKQVPAYVIVMHPGWYDHVGEMKEDIALCPAHRDGTDREPDRRGYPEERPSTSYSYTLNNAFAGTSGTTANYRRMGNQ